MSERYRPPVMWMGSAVPGDVRDEWLGCAGKYWRLGILDALKVVSKTHEISTMVNTWAPGERIDRDARVAARKAGS